MRIHIIKGSFVKCAGVLAALALFVNISQVLDENISPPSKASFDEIEMNSLNFASFGSSHTWGADLDDRRKMAYPYLLSPNAKNLARPGDTLRYPSLCLSSLIGDDILDVVILEGRWRPGYPGDKLAKRLRQRFPDLIIIFLDHKYPLLIHWVTDTEETHHHLNLKEWAEENATGIDKADPMFVSQMEEFANDGKGSFKFNHWANEMVDKFEDIIDLEQLARDLGPSTYIIDVYNDLDPIKFMRKFSSYTGDDFFHPSATGHTNYASFVADVIQQNIKDYPEHPRVNPWYSQDVCETWFMPDSPLPEINFPTDGLVEMCMTETKCALEVRGDPKAGESNDISGTMTINNPSDVEQILTIQFMVTGPSTNNMVYPKTKILKWPKGEDEASAQEFIVEPVTDKYKEKKVHVAHAFEMGRIPPGETIIKFVQLETNKQHPFRVIAYMITPQ